MGELYQCFWMMKEFSKDNDVVYVDKPEDALWKVIELIENGCIEKEGMTGLWKIVER